MLINSQQLRLHITDKVEARQKHSIKKERGELSSTNAKTLLAIKSTRERKVFLEGMVPSRLKTVKWKAIQPRVCEWQTFDLGINFKKVRRDTQLGGKRRGSGSERSRGWSDSPHNIIPGSLELKLHVVVRGLAWILRIEVVFFARAYSILF